MVERYNTRICEQNEAISVFSTQELRRPPNTSVGASRKFMMKILIIVLLTIMIQLPSYAALDWAYLGIPQGARETSMGETGVSLASSGNGAWWNPAHIASSQTGMWLQTFRWITDGKGSYGGFNIPTSWGGLSAYYVNHGMEGFEARDRPGAPESEFTLRQSVLAGGAAFNLPSNIALGIVWKQTIEVIQGSRAHRENILDIGLNWRSNNYSAGFTAANIVFDDKSVDGKDENLPLTFRTGVSYTNNIDDYRIILAYGGDLRRSPVVGEEDEFDFINKLGLEVGWSEMLYGRLGFISGYDSRSLTYGVGVLVKEIYLFDFAVVPTENDLGTTWKMGLGIVS
jgi:hypothetical protein